MSIALSDTGIEKNKKNSYLKQGITFREYQNYKI